MLQNFIFTCIITNTMLRSEKVMGRKFGKIMYLHGQKFKRALFDFL